MSLPGFKRTHRMEENLNLICWIWMIMGAMTFVLLQFISAPYGRHNRSGWGPQISNRWGWVLMEFPSFGIIAYFFLSSNQSEYAAMLSVIWLIHYFNRTFIFPFRLRTSGKKMPLVIVLSAVFFNLVNAGLNGFFLTRIESYQSDDFYSWNFVLGTILLALGFVINQKSDNILIGLRKGGSTDYKIPRGFLFEKVSCPNHLGEFVQWTGFALMAWNLPALTFLVWTAANLFPRSANHHQWYQEKFEDYPPKRKILFPGIW